MEIGIYEALITSSLREKLEGLDKSRYFVAADKKLDAAEASRFLGNHLSKVVLQALKMIKSEKEGLSQVEKQIDISNKILMLLSKEITAYDFKSDLMEAHGYLLEGVFDKLNSEYTDLNIRLKEIMPVTRLTQSELFTGGNVGISLESELKKEIRSADRVDLLVSFIKWKAIVILKDALEEFTKRGGKLRVITTTYMGATDAKAIDELSKLPNTEVKISYNNSNERLHAKAYLFYRNTGFHTGYIGSSNFSRSALTDGLEWNVKITTAEIPHIIDKFRKTFESYWSSPEFEPYTADGLGDLHNALVAHRMGKETREHANFFDLEPYHYQKEILEKLQVERKVHHSDRNLVVAATGTGKTMLAAFDFKAFKKQKGEVKFLFIAHRIEILRQALHSFRNVLKDNNFGELMGDGYEPTQKSAVFATVQTFNRLSLSEFCTPDYYDYVVIDEVHHAQATTYQNIIHYFKPQVLLGLTATPERMDGKDILPDFNHRIAAEIRLPDALNNKLLCPFQYFGITDAINYENISWNNGRYDSKELTQVLTANDVRVRDVIFNLEKYTRDPMAVSCIGFCASKEHAFYMAEKFNKAGFHSSSLTSDNAKDREGLLNEFKQGKINYLFVVDMFNEGVDIPMIDTVLFLRPTESLTVFLQQLGRGLRLHEGKDVLTVLDFVGHARSEYDFESKFRALIGKTNTTVAHEINGDFPNLPLGCSIVLERIAKEHILKNILKATQMNKRQLINKMIHFKNQTQLPLTLQNFLSIYHLKLSDVYKNNTFTQLKAAAFSSNYDLFQEDAYKSMLGKKWMVTESLVYFQFVKRLISSGFDIAEMNLTLEEKSMATMVYYDFYQKASQGVSLSEAILNIGSNVDFVKELSELIEVKLNLIYFEEMPCSQPAHFPLHIHGRYTREQILIAMGLSTYEKQSSNREGVALNKTTNTEALFVNLKKSEEDFSPTTLYDDYAISDTLFHWQSQNQTAFDSEKGLSYINHAQRHKNILMFVRESKEDAFGFTQGYVFLGPAQFVSFEGSKPMSIKWELHEPIPNYLWKESAKMLVG